MNAALKIPRVNNRPVERGCRQRPSRARIALDRTWLPRHDVPMRQLSLILLMACAACSASDPSTRPAPGSAPVAADLPAQMRVLVGSAACTESTQCKTVPLGARSCGGPEGYLAYSTAVTASAQLQALAARHAEQRRAAAASSGMLSSCQILPDPGAQCRVGVCVLGSAATGS
jgi:hypothetical protein